MSLARVVHLIPQSGGRWEVRFDGTAAISFLDLGLALDAATRLAEPHGSARVVVHESLESKAS